MSKKLTTGVAIAGLLGPAGAQALGVGDIKLQSYLNQPLRAEIPLVLSQERLADVPGERFRRRRAGTAACSNQAPIRTSADARWWFCDSRRFERAHPRTFPQFPGGTDLA